MNRTKALLGLLWPCLAFAVVVLLSSGFRHARPAPGAATASGETRTSQGGWLFADTASSGDATVEVTHRLQEIPGKGATTVTTYTVIGTF